MQLPQRRSEGVEFHGITRNVGRAQIALIKNLTVKPHGALGKRAATQFVAGEEMFVDQRDLQSGSRRPTCSRRARRPCANHDKVEM